MKQPVGQIQAICRQRREMLRYLAESEVRVAETATFLRDGLMEKMRDVQTGVLRAFHSWPRATEVKLRALPLLEDRVSPLEERVTAIERGDKPRLSPDHRKPAGRAGFHVRITKHPGNHALEPSLHTHTPRGPC